jgi:putative ABC transport system permease protein
MRIPVLAGRAFTDRDRDGAPPVLVVSRRAAEQYWPGEDPIGRTAAIQKGSGAPRTIVGVVADVRSQALTSEPVPEFYVPHAQDPSPAVAYVVRSGQSAGGSLAAARQVVQGFDPKLPLVGAASMRQRVHDASARPRFSLALIGGFAALGLLLAAVGIYGVVAYAVGQRTREIGVRMALGARPAEVASLVLWQGMRPAIAGVAVGLLATLAGGRLVANLLYQVRPTTSRRSRVWSGWCSRSSSLRASFRRAAPPASPPRPPCGPSEPHHLAPSVTYSSWNEKGVAFV